MKVNVSRQFYFLPILIILLFSGSMGQQKDIVGYFPSWKWRYKNSLMTYDKIPFKKLTIIDYAFWHPLTDGTIAAINPKGDSLNLIGDGSKEMLVQVAHDNNVKVMLSVGGWEDSNNFPTVASTAPLRTTFAHACIDAIRKFSFDGIDIDWEYPGYTDHNGTPADKINCTLLLSVLKDSLDAYGKEAGRKMLLSAALPASAEHLTGFEIDKLIPVLDMFNIMTYDYNGSWSSLSGHNSPLYASTPEDTLHNIDASFKLFTDQLHVPASKINLGVPFYGHSFAQCTSLNAHYRGSDTTLFPDDGLCYYDIVPYLGKYRHWDERAKVPYLIIPDANTLVSFDDEESVALKAQYVLDHTARGVIIWEITGDYMPNGKTPLLDVLNEKLASSRTSY
ncbi:MAG TPA: glycosyl hydrolase family 18 protein [Bacteroidota bacterium]|nr:glycosyl hydrolase family 18 protein [Bacteroidota bacterium]